MLDGIPTGIGAFLDRGLFIGTVALIVLAYIFGWWVSGREYRSTVRDRDFWRALALKNANIAESVTSERSAGVTALESVAKSAVENAGGDP